MSGKNNKIVPGLLKFLACYLAVMGVVFAIVHNVAEAGERNKLWTDIMLFVNFGVMVFLFLRFAKKPLINFLRGEGNKISEQMQAIETEVNDARSKMEKESDRLKNITESLKGITENIIAAGAREKESVIERAKNLADKMVEDAKKEAAFKMEAAKKRFSEEMLDAAINITIDSIKQNITKEDDEKLVMDFSSDLVSGQSTSV